MVKRNNSPLPGNFSVLFATFSVWHDHTRLPINGSLDPLRDFLVPRIKKLVIIDQLHPGSEDVMPKIEVYTHHNMKFTPYHSSWYIYVLKPILELVNTSGTHVSFKIRDFLSVIDWSFRDNTRFDYFIGLESINVLAGILLRNLGRIKTVIYYVSDYSPNRFRNGWFNGMYLGLDRFCAVHADYIWDVSKAMQPARISAGLDPQRSAPVIHVPNGLYPDQIKVNAISGIGKHTMVYMGTLGAENGPDIALGALSLVKKEFPDTVLHILGGTGKDFAWLEKIIVNMNLEQAVIFHGFVPKNSDMSEIIRSCALGLAPYRNFEGSPRLYADAGKIRAYCASGLPTVSSQVPPLGREVAQKGAAVIAHDDAKSFARAILHIFNNPNVYMKLRKNAISLAKDNTWDNTFSNAFRQMSI